MNSSRSEVSAQRSQIGNYGSLIGLSEGRMESVPLSSQEDGKTNGV